MGCSGNYDCGCGCNSNISCGSNKTCNQTYSGIYFCKDPLCYVKTNFIVPAANVVLAIEVTDSSKLYVGEGIQIGNAGYFQVVSIEDTTNISIAHNGAATPNFQVIAVQPSYGCYQYPIQYVGEVPLLNVPAVIALNDAMTALISSAILNITVQELTYGFLGPNRVQFDAQLHADTANTPFWIGFLLPIVPVAAIPLPIFSGFIDRGAGRTNGVAQLGEGVYTGYAVIGPGGAASIANGTSRKFRISGIYEI